MQGEARRNCPVDTGNLRRSIALAIEGNSYKNMSARVGSNVEYARVVEEGHGPIVPVRAKALRFPVKGGAIVFAMRVRAVPGTHFLRNALRTVVR